MDRREFLLFSSGTLAATWLFSFGGDRKNNLLERFRGGRGTVVPVDPAEAVDSQIELVRSRDGNFSKTKLINHGKKSVRVKEVVLCETAHDLPPETHLYGESFQMLSQTGGTLGSPQDLGYSELKHYRIPQPQDAVALSGLLALSPPGRPVFVAGFSSCSRFIARFYLSGDSIKAVLDTEGLDLAPGETWELEELMVAEDSHRSKLLKDLAT